MKYKVILISSMVLATLMLSACSSSTSIVNMEHIHGLGYTSDGKQIMIPAHSGLVAYAEGKWINVDAPKNDYMGFVTVDNGFYSSGHPGQGSKLKNPIGVVKSTDVGKTLATLDLEGQSDFHAMAVGYKTHTIYVFNEHPNAKMKAASMYFTKDDAKTWNKAELNGFSGEPITIAAHPSDDKVVVLGSKEGLFLSNDSGNHFEKLISGLVVTSLAFSHNGELFVSATNSPALLQINVSNKDKNEIKIPALAKDDAISYIAQNPINTHEIVVATFKNDVFMSKDAGVKWTKIADKGNGLSK